MSAETSSTADSPEILTLVVIAVYYFQLSWYDFADWLSLVLI